MPAKRNPLDQTLAALGDRARRTIVDLLAREPMRPGQLAEALEMSPQSMSRHLRVLRRAGLVRDRALADDARVRIYELERGPIDHPKGWLEDIEGFWTAQLSGFRDHVEKKR